ncbi:protein RCC2 [Turdus rufiventris]|nr:protein RCC2 [Turdus rufiventris]
MAAKKRRKIAVKSSQKAAKNGREKAPKIAAKSSQKAAKNRREKARKNGGKKRRKMAAKKRRKSATKKRQKGSEKKLEGSRSRGQLLIFGATNWDLIGRKEVPKQQESGSVFAFGENKLGQLGLGNQTDAVPSPTQILYNGQPISKLGCGAEFSMVMDCKGNLYSFGCPEYGQLGGLFFWGATNTSRESTMYPKAVQDLCGWKIRSLACGKSSVIVAADESTISWGPSPTFGELGYGDHKPKSSTAAQEVKTLDGIYTEQVAMGYSHSLVIARDESEAEQEKLRKLPEYNPRTL